VVVEIRVVFHVARRVGLPGALVQDVVERSGVDRRLVVTAPHADRRVIVQQVDHPFQLAPGLLVERR
jgi:hypothetical protein